MDVEGRDESYGDGSKLENLLKNLTEGQAALVDEGLVIASAHIAFAIKAIEDAV